MECCKLLCCHSWVGWRPADRTQETENGRQGRTKYWACIEFIVALSFYCLLPLLSAPPVGKSIIWGDSELRLSQLFHFLFSLHPPSLSDFSVVCADSLMLLNCFGKALFKLPFSKKESFRRQGVFRANMGFFCLYKTGRSGQCKHPFESKSLF